VDVRKLGFAVVIGVAFGAAVAASATGTVHVPADQALLVEEPVTSPSYPERRPRIFYDPSADATDVFP
jgi:hypothetical protein